ncbi:MAG: hypothetical protein EXR52_00430 [Dehalococcoidia bacterium]|nr:hypothetical protein [Dehalococcoidia bacterium]
MQAAFSAAAEFAGFSLFSRFSRPFVKAAQAVANDATARERMVIAGYEETRAQVQETDFSASYNLLSALR